MKLTKGQIDLLRRLAHGELISWDPDTQILRGLSGKAIRVNHNALLDNGLIDVRETPFRVKRLLITETGRVYLAEHEVTK